MIQYQRSLPWGVTWQVSGEIFPVFCLLDFIKENIDFSIRAMVIPAAKHLEQDCDISSGITWGGQRVIQNVCRLYAGFDQLSHKLAHHHHFTRAQRSSKGKSIANACIHHTFVECREENTFRGILKSDTRRNFKLPLRIIEGQSVKQTIVGYGMHRSSFSYPRRQHSKSIVFQHPDQKSKHD